MPNPRRRGSAIHPTTMKTHFTLALISTGLLGVAATSHATLIYGLTSSNQLVSFDSALPTAILSSVAISQPGIIDIDGYPANGGFYGMTSNGNAYRINVTSGAATLAVTPGAGVGTVTDFDFNPSADRIRIFSTGSQNFRMVPDFTTNNPGTTGAVTADGMFTNLTFNLVGNAYTNNVDSQGGATTLYSIDTVNNALVQHTVAPQFNTVTIVGTNLGIGDIGSNVGFDVGQDGVAYLSNGAVLFTVNLTTGAATAAGTIADANVVSIAAVVPEPGSAFVAAAGLAGLALRRRRR